jgi:hypothetical protein
LVFKILSFMYVPKFTEGRKAIEETKEEEVWEDTR